MSDKPISQDNPMPPLHGDPRKPGIILLSSTILMLLWRYVGSPEFYLSHLAHRWDVGHPQSAAAVYSFISCFVLLGLVPAMIVVFGFRESLKDYGVGLGNRLRTFRSMLVVVPLFVIGGIVTGMNSGVGDELLSNPQLGKTMPFGLHALTYLILYIGWEFHFRGFLQFGLTPQMGRSTAVLVQVMASGLLHIGAPALETFAAIAGGVLWGLLAYRTRSILSGIMQHAALGLTVDWMAAFYSG